VQQPPRVLVALITAFAANGDVSLDDHAHNVRHLLDRGIRGFLIGGSTGEGPYLDEGERTELVATTRDVAGAEVYVMGATAAQSTRGAISQITEISEGGADAALVLTPTSLIRGNHAAVHRFFVEIADVSPIPILMYSVPRVTGYELPVAVIAALAGHPNVIGLKDSGGRPYRMQEVARSVDNSFMQFAGASAAIASSIAGGGYGSITASTNYLPEQIDYLVAASRRGDRDLDTLQSDVTAITKVVEAHGVVGTKAAAVASGMRSDRVRRPLVPLDQAAFAEIRSVIPSPL
jgi:4-hydroxy-2-oxoglutarate aldolase